MPSIAPLSAGNGDDSGTQLLGRIADVGRVSIGTESAGDSTTVTRKKRPRTGPQLYDFRQPNKLGRDHTRALQVANETFARQATTILTTSLRATSSMTLLSVEQRTYDEYISSLATPTFLVTIAVEPLPGVVMLEFSLRTAMVAVDHLLGGSGGVDQPERPLTDIESALLTSLVRRLVNEMPYAFEALVSIRPELISIELSPQFVQNAAPSDVMIVASFDMRIGQEETLGTLCWPFEALHGALEAMSAKPLRGGLGAAEAAAIEATISEQISTAPVDVTVRFDSVALTPAEILCLEPGDVLPLGHPVAAPLALAVAGVPYASAVPGSTGKRLACRIVDI